MRTLLLMRGAPGCGKSTWIEENGLKPYTLCADDIRLLCQSPVLTVDGTEAISQENEKIVWNVLFEILERRMQRGEFTVIDATNSKTSEMNRYKKLCDDYRYRIFCVDFTDIPIDVCKKRNLEREEIKQVPENVIDKVYSRFAVQKIPSGIKVIKPNELDQVYFRIIDLSNYKTIHHIGDIHGCYTALKTYFDLNHGMKDDEYYIFTGDYIDRGIQNAEVIEFLLSIKDKKNVLLLEGNHERWLWDWANDIPAKSKEFELNTKPQLEKAKISKKDARQLYRKLGQCAYYKFDNKVVLVTHGGISNIPENLSFTATEQLIKGVGSYNDHEKVENAFKDNVPSNYYQVHGHRNTKGVNVCVNGQVFNLEGKVEFGGKLRCAKLNHNSPWETWETDNPVFKTTDEVECDVTKSDMADTIVALRSNKYIREKSFGEISSFNFTKQAFFDKIWDEQTTKARGLYIDTKKGKVAARAYNKFFNINERQETKLDNLQNKLKFPVTAYVKENGFLGIVSWDEYKNDLLIASKSEYGGTFAGYLENILQEKMTRRNFEKMGAYAKEHDVTFVFECVDMEHDPHVIEYPENELFLLDIVYNSIDFKKYDYAQMCDVADQFGLKHKTLAYEIPTWQDFFDWYNEVLEPDYKFNDRIIEGFVIEDSKGYMLKLKLSYYNFWKFMRSIAQETFKNGYTKRTSALTTATANQFYGWCKKVYEQEDPGNIAKDICSLRNTFYKEMDKTARNN